MNMPLQHKMEELSKVYISAIAAKAGVTINFVNRDYKVDGKFNQIIKFGNKFVESGISLDFQLKSTMSFENTKSSVKYDLDIDTYNYLVERNRHNNSLSPCVLILLCLPDEQYWISVTELSLMIRKCCYWAIINGNTSRNRSSVRIEISRNNIFSPTSLQKLLNEINEGR